MSNHDRSPRALSRRQFLVLTGSGVAATAILAACGTSSPTRSAKDLIGPGSDAVTRAEARRRRAGARVRDVALTAAPLTVDLGGRRVSTLAYNGTVPGPLVRATVGDVLRVRLTNGLKEPTTIHWHGLSLRNDMDGVPDLTQPPVQPGGAFTYEFTVPDAGTYWFHPHVGVQLDYGMYAPLIVDDADDPGGYDAEWIVVFDDWTDGVGESPAAVFDRLRRGMGTSGDMSEMTTTTMPTGSGMPEMPGMGSMPSGMPGMPSGNDTTTPTTTMRPPTTAMGSSTTMGNGARAMPGDSPLLGGDSGDVRYPLYLANGRTATDPETFSAKPGQRVRLRMINAASDTAFRVALAGHRLAVTHADGFPVERTEAGAVLLGMGERIDAIVTVGDGAFDLVAAAEGKRASARAVLRTASGAPGGPNAARRELAGRALTVHDLRPSGNALPAEAPDRRYDVRLGGDMMRYRWTINGRTFGDHQPLAVQEDERVRLTFINDTMMFHPMHLHGHTFAVVDPAGRPGVRKDTVIVRPAERITIDVAADNPGQWLIHCHNAYHAEAGMATVLSYQA